MKNLSIALLVSFVLLQNCQQSEFNGKPTLNSDQLTKVLNGSKTFNALVDHHITFIQESSRNISKLSDQKLEELSSTLSGKDVMAVALESSPDQRRTFLGFASGTQSPLESGYTRLVNELSLKYIFNAQDVRDAIKTEFELRYSESEFGRTQISCAGQCSNGSEATYWRVFDATGDSDLGALCANWYYAGCLNGCAQK